MNLSLKPNPLIALWIPGTLLISVIIWTCPIITIYSHNIPNLLQNNWSSVSVGSATLIIFIISLLGFLAGEILDCTRDIIEDCILDKIKQCRINWDFFFEAEKEKIINLEEWYYTIL